MSANSDKPRLYHLDKKAKVRHAPVLSFDTHSNNTNSVDSNMTNSSIYSKDSEAADILQSSQSSMSSKKHSPESLQFSQSSIFPEIHPAETLQSPQSSMSSKKHSAEILQSSQSSIFPEKDQAEMLQSPQSSMTSETYSAGRQPTTTPNEYSAKILADSSDYWPSEDESPGPPDSGTFHAPFRNSGPDLMTLHIFTGKMNGEKPIYVPVYTRNDRGKLFKLVQLESGDWKYLEMKMVTEDEEAGGLNLFKIEVVLQSSKPKKPKKAGSRRTLADFGLPETKPQGGWGWL